MRLVVCPLDQVQDMVRRHRPHAVVSLLDQPPPPLDGDLARLVLRFHDIAEPQEGLVAPDAAHIIRLLTFAAARGPEETVLLHCWMGVSRSPAAAYILACAAAPAISEVQIARALREAAPGATPNPLMVSLADTHLGRGGRMTAAIALIGRGREEASGVPFELDTASFDSAPGTFPP
jgi:predicted protein tyrosine phosphatase